MSTINGLPAHALLVHFIVVLAPLTAIVSAVWVSARQRLVWLVFALAVVTSILTPLTTQAGEWLENRSGRTPLLRAHTELGDTMIYFSVALVVAAMLLAFVHIRESRGPVRRWVCLPVLRLARRLRRAAQHHKADPPVPAEHLRQT